MRTRSNFLILLCLTHVDTFAQQHPRLQFEVASIRPSTSSATNGGFNFGENSRFTAENVPLDFLIASAYQVKTFQVTGGPGWAETTAWNITAKGAGNTTPEQIMWMLQALLEDRFKLKVHRATKRHDLYALLPARSGLKIHASAADCDALAGSARPGEQSGKQCGSWFEGASEILGTKVSMDQFVHALSESVELPVIDKTGFKGLVDVKLNWIPGGDSPGDDPARPSIFTALQEQLGLKLESRKGPVEMLVIDSVEKPSEN